VRDAFSWRDEEHHAQGALLHKGNVTVGRALPAIVVPRNRRRAVPALRAMPSVTLAKSFAHKVRSYKK
jgi:hypothetical protein